ncbi:MAG: SAM domain-containing protein [Promethearchaeia archaeon]
MVENDIDGAVLMNLENDDLIAMGIQSVGKRKSILSQVSKFKLQSKQKIIYTDLKMSNRGLAADDEAVGKRSLLKKFLFGSSKD